jgi:hypothetical protein
MLVLGGLGLMHARRTSPDIDILNSRATSTPDTGTTPVPATLSSGNGLAPAAPGSSPGQPA